MRNTGPVYINIPVPCGEHWDTMEPAEQGRNCARCSTTVIDFTGWSDSDLYRFFAGRNEQVCGQYLASQVGRPIDIPIQPRGNFFRLAMAMGFVLLFTNVPQAAATRPPLYWHHPAPDCSASNAAADTMSKLSGTVLDAKKEPVAGASVAALQNGVVKAGAVTDYDGNFVIQGLDQGRYDLLVTYTGLDLKTIKDIAVTQTAGKINVIMDAPKPRTLKGNVIIGYHKPLTDPQTGKDTTKH